MDITPFIHDLILLNECVILRGFGGFDTSYKQAIVNKRKKVILPPSKKVTFRPEWIKDNGILEEQLVNSLGIETEAASKLIDEYVSHVHRELKEKGLFEMQGVGHFVMSEEGRVSFTEFEGENYLADSFGLEVLELDMVPQHEEKKQVPQPLKPIVQPKRKLTGWFVAVGMLVLASLITLLILLSGTGGISIFKSGSPKGSTITDTALVVFGQQKRVLEDSVLIAIEQTLDKNTETKKALAIEPLPPANLVENSTYYLIAGSFKNQKNAEVLKAQLEQKGFKPQVVNLGGDFVRVILGTYTLKQEALNELNRIRRQTEQSVWIMEKKQP